MNESASIRERVAALDSGRRDELARVLEVGGVGRTRLAAYVEADEKRNEPIADELRAHVAGRLPDYMVPASYVTVEKLQRLPNGKLDRNAFGSLAAAAREEESSGVMAPRNAAEEKLADIWKRVLEIDEVGIDDDFFEFGGHSLLAVVLVTEIDRAFGVRLPTSVLAEAPTIEALAERIESSGVAEPGARSSDSYVFVPAATGDLMLHMELENAPGDAWEFGKRYRATKIDVKYNSETRIEELAERFILEMRKIQPEGALHLATRDCSTHIALEIAQRQYARGDEVAFFAAIDSYPPWFAGSVAERYAREALSHLRGLDFRRLFRKIYKVFQFRLRVLRGKYEEIKQPPESVSAPRPYTYPEANSRYLAKVYPGKVTLFITTDYENGPDGKECIRRWKRLAGGGLDIVRVTRDRAPDTFEQTLIQKIEDFLPERYGPEQV